MSDQPEALRLADEIDTEELSMDRVEKWVEEAAAELRRQHDEIEQLKAERDAAVKALRFLFDHGAYLTERVPDDLKAAIDAARSKT